MQTITTIILVVNALLLNVQHGHVSSSVKNDTLTVASTTIAAFNQSTTTAQASLGKVKGKYQIVIVPVEVKAVQPPTCHRTKTDYTCSF